MLSSSSITFAAAAGATSATRTITLWNPGSPQTSILSGVGSTRTTTRTLITEPDQQFSAIYNLITSAASSIEMTMYELTDTKVEQELAAAAAKDIKLRVILDQNLEKSNNTPAYNYLLANGVNVVFSSTFFQALPIRSRLSWTRKPSPL